MAKTKKRLKAEPVVGRPSKYKPEFAHMAYCMALAGMIDIQMAEALEVSESTFNNWKDRYPEFLESIKKGRSFADAQVAEALFHRAIGFTHAATKVIQTKNGNRNKTTTTYYPPDVTACIYWLKNRCREQWRETQDHQVGLTFPMLMKRGLLKAKEQEESGG